MGQNYECDDQMVSHPSHYQSKTGLEVIDVIEKYTNPISGVYASDTANMIKYSCRWKHKNGIQDVKKILWYATHLKNELMESAKFFSGYSIIDAGPTLEDVIVSFVTEDMDDIETLCTHEIIVRSCTWHFGQSFNWFADIESIIRHATMLVKHLEEKESN